MKEGWRLLSCVLKTEKPSWRKTAVSDRTERKEKRKRARACPFTLRFGWV